MLRALSPGLRTVHGKRRTCNLVVSQCIQRSKSMVDAVRSMETIGGSRTLHKGDHVQVQIAVAPNDSRTLKNSVHIDTQPSKCLHGVEKGQNPHRLTEQEDATARPLLSAKYLQQQNLKDRMHARTRIVAPHADNRQPTKRFRRLLQLKETYVREQGEEEKRIMSSKRVVRPVVPPDPVVEGHLNTLRNSKDSNELWDAYQALLLFDSSPPSPPPISSIDPHATPASDSVSTSNPSSPTSQLPSQPTVPLQLLRRLARVLAGTQPRTRTLFLRLLSVLSACAARGDAVQVWAWNALIDCAGKGWRRTRVAEYRTALGVYNDMISGGRTKAALDDEGGRDSDSDVGNEPEKGVKEKGKEIVTEPVEPDIITLTTLLDIAIETQSDAAIRHASFLLDNSGLQPTIITHLVRLKDRRHLSGLKAVRETYRNIKTDCQGELNIIALNAMLWTISMEGRWDVLFDIYRVLRQNVEGLDLHESQREDVNDSKVVEGIPIHRSLIPNIITYTTLIQCLSYNGQLLQAIEVFRDMLHRAEASGDHTLQPSLPIFRALFCAFAKHTTAPAKSTKSSPRSTIPSNGEWTEGNLDVLLNHFLQLPNTVPPNDRTIYWIMSSYINLCGKHSPKVYEVYKRLSERFKIKSTGRTGRMKKVYGSPPIDSRNSHETLPR